MPQLSRRAFAQLIGTAAAATALPLPLLARPVAVPGTVRLSANENPYGPSPAALQAMRDAFPQARLYPEPRLLARIPIRIFDNSIPGSSSMATAGTLITT